MGRHRKEIALLPDEIKKMLEEVEKPELIQFYGLWLKHNRNATQAYKEMKPDVSMGSASVMGSKYLNELGQVNKQLILASYGLDTGRYMTQLSQGLEATKRDHFTGEIEADHKTRKPYHDKLGRLLDLETQQETSINFFNFVKDQKNTYNI